MGTPSLQIATFYHFSQLTHKYHFIEFFYFYSWPFTVNSSEPPMEPGQIIHDEFPCVFVPHVSDVFAGVGVGGLLVTQDVGVVVVLPVRGAVAGAAVQARALVVHRHVAVIILSRYHQLIM